MNKLCRSVKGMKQTCACKGTQGCQEKRIKRKSFLWYLHVCKLVMCLPL